MFCGKCGVENASDAAFCSGCGAKLNDEQVTKTDAAASGAGDKNRKVGVIAAAVLAVAVICIIIALFGGRSYKATANRFIKAQFNADAEAVLDLVPNKVVDYLLEEEGYDEDELDEFIEEADDTLQSYIELIELFLGVDSDDWKITHEIADVDNVTGDDLDDLKDAYEDIGVKVSAAKIVEVELTIKFDKEEETDSMELALIKVGRSWYMDVESMGSFF